MKKLTLTIAVIASLTVAAIHHVSTKLPLEEGCTTDAECCLMDPNADTEFCFGE